MTLRQTSNNNLSGLHLAVLAIGTFTLGMDGFVLTGLLPQIAHDLDVTIATAGQLTTAFALTYAVAAPVVAAATNSWDRRVVLAAGLTIFILGMTCQALGSAYAIVAAGRILAAIGAAAFQATAYAMAGMLSSEERRGRSLAAVTAGASLALVLGVPFGVLVGQLIGWRGAMWTIVAIAVIAAAFVLVLPSAHIPPTSLRSRLSVLSRPLALRILASTILVLTPAFLVVSFLPSLFGSDTPGGLFVVALVAHGAGQVVGNRLVGRLVDTRGALPTLIIGVAGMTASFAALIALRQWYAPTLILLFVIGGFIGFLFTPQQHRLFTFVPEMATVALGLNGSAIYVGSAFGAAAGGLALSAFGPAALAPAGAILGALALLICWWNAPERAAKRAADQAGTRTAKRA